MSRVTSDSRHGRAVYRTARVGSHYRLRTLFSRPLRSLSGVRVSSKRSREAPTATEGSQRDEAVERLPLEDNGTPYETYLSTWDDLPSRVKLLIYGFVSFIICNMDKVNTSVAIIPMAREFGWNATVSGVVQSAFFYGYMLCQLPGGFLSTRFSGKRMLPIGVGIWSLSTFALPAVGSSIGGLCASRSVVGLGEALAPAAAADVIAKVVPPGERTRAVSFVNSGLYLGTILGLLTSPLLINAFGWQSVFYVFGGVGLIWVVAWEIQVERMKTADPDTYAKLQSLSQDKSVTQQKAIPWRGMLRCRPVQALMYTHFCSAWFHFAILSWLPSYFSSTLGLDVGDAARISLMPPIAGIVVSSLAGPAADGLISRGWKTGVVRKIAQCTAFLGPSACLVAASFTDSGDAKIALLTAAIGLGSFCLPGLYSNSQDLSPKYAGFLLSVTTTCAAIPGIIGEISVHVRVVRGAVGVPFTGAILDATHSWPLALFAPSILVMISGALVFGIFGRGHEITFPDNAPFAIEKRLWGEA